MQLPCPVKSPLLRDGLTLALIWYIVCPAPAHAYFDLGTGTYMLQLIFGFGAAFWITFRNSWLKRWRKPAEPANESNQSASVEKEV